MMSTAAIDHSELHHDRPDATLGRAAPSSKSKTNQAIVCQVEDCQAPLAGLKDYHIRYKICERHLKEEWIEKDGQRVRFCQQCGRFQPLEEFEENKRSCRARLMRHNERRRKRTRDLERTTFEIGEGLPGLAPEDMPTMQEAMQFASATLMHATANAASGTNMGATLHLGNQPVGPSEMAAASTSAAIAGMPFGGGLVAAPYVPSPQVMTLLLRSYAGMFHYAIEDLKITPRVPPTPAEELTKPLDAAAAAAMVASGGENGIENNAVGGDESAAAHLLAIQAAQGQQYMMAGNVLMAGTVEGNYTAGLQGQQATVDMGGE